MAARKRGRVTMQYQPTRETRTVQRIAMLPFLIVSIGFVIIGVTVVIPGAGMFGVLWTLVAASFVVIAIVNMVRKNGMAHRVGYDVETDIQRETIVGIMDEVDDTESGGDVKQRMKQLRSLYDQRLITQEEYEQKRQEILKEL